MESERKKGISFFFMRNRVVQQLISSLQILRILIDELEVFKALLESHIFIIRMQR